RITAVDRAGESPCRKIEPRGAQLPLVVAVGRERYDGPVYGEHVSHDLVDLTRPAAAALVREWARIAQQDQHQCVTHARQTRLIALEPGDRPDGPGRKHEAVAEASRLARDPFR